jgi:hypothetical protein
MNSITSTFGVCNKHASMCPSTLYQFVSEGRQLVVATVMTHVIHSVQLEKSVSLSACLIWNCNRAQMPSISWRVRNFVYNYYRTLFAVFACITVVLTHVRRESLLVDTCANNRIFQCDMVLDEFRRVIIESHIDFILTDTLACAWVVELCYRVDRVSCPG